MLKFRYGREDAEAEPLDFIKPIMIFYLNTIRQYQLEMCL